MCKWIVSLFLAFSALLSAETKVLAFAGSAREDSVNKKLVIEAANMARQMGTTVTIIDLKDYPLPLYDGDYEIKDGMPQKAKEIRRLMIESNIIFIASPEYNGSLSGLLKNTIDWASRTETGGGSAAAFKGKKFLIMSASPGQGGGARGLVHLRKILENLGGIVVAEQMVVPNAGSAFDEKGNLVNQKLRNELQQMVKTAIN